MPEDVAHPEPRAVSACRYRANVRVQDDSGAEVATCGLVGELTGLIGVASCEVGVDACEACCRSFPPSPEGINTVVASLLYKAAEEGVGLEDVEKSALKLRALAALDADGAGRPARPPAALRSRLAAPFGRGPGRVKTWSVGVTTAPRKRPTLDRCLESLAKAGWPCPHLFVDSEVPLSGHAAALPKTCRDVRLGAWPSYQLALHELVMRQPRADAFMLVQDDALFYEHELLREYLEGEVLWPDRGFDRGLGLVSLYCSSAYMKPRAGWHTIGHPWGWGALAFIFPNALAREFLIDREVFDHRWVGRSDGLAHIDVVIGAWAVRRNVPIWYPSPSLVQHIGETSALWSWGRAEGDRKAGWFAGDPSP